MKVTKIVSNLRAVVPIGAYENLKPGFEIQMDMAEGDNLDEAFKYANDYIKKMLESFSNNAKADLIEKQYANIRLYEKDGKKYPSVTSILGWDTDWKITEDELQQYEELYRPGSDRRAICGCNGSYGAISDGARVYKRRRASYPSRCSFHNARLSGR